jgi:hypothetical protein
MLEPQIHDGLTAEGLPLRITLWFPPQAPVGAAPVEVTGIYAARDGGGTFALERTPAGRWRDADQGRESDPPDDLLPWVVTAGYW